MHEFIYASIFPYWNKKEITIKHLTYIYHQSIYLKNSSEYEHLSLEEKGNVLKTFANVNLGEGEEPLETQLKFSKKWDNKTKLYIIKPCKKALEQL
jgi:hypothetical protein